MSLRFFLDNAWRRMCDLDEVPRKVSDINALIKSCVSEDFHKKMIIRMVMGAFRYDQKRKNKTQHFIWVVSRELALYKKTGNREALIDAANYLMLGFEYGPHKNKKIRSTDDQDHWHPIIK